MIGAKVSKAQFGKAAGLAPARRVRCNAEAVKVCSWSLVPLSTRRYAVGRRCLAREAMVPSRIDPAHRAAWRAAAPMEAVRSDFSSLAVLAGAPGPTWPGYSATGYHCWSGRH
jgi:hypothetical protein